MTSKGQGCGQELISSDTPGGEAAGDLTSDLVSPVKVQLWGWDMAAVLDLLTFLVILKSACCAQPRPGR